MLVIWSPRIEIGVPAGLFPTAGAGSALPEDNEICHRIDRSDALSSGSPVVSSSYTTSEWHPARTRAAPPASFDIGVKKLSSPSFSSFSLAKASLGGSQTPTATNSSVVRVQFKFEAKDE